MTLLKDGFLARRADLTALVGSRICHDLISPLGAIGNGVELLELSGIPHTPEMALISESVETANAKIRFFRIAYGMAQPDQRIARSEVTATLTAAARSGRISYFWSPDGDQNRAEVRAVFLLLQCFESAMPHGGDIRVERDGPHWELTCEGDHLKVDEVLWGTMMSARNRPAVTASQVQFLLLPEVLNDLNRALALKIDRDRIVARF
jgi:histidine phosphotransferase ChpT